MENFVNIFTTVLAVCLLNGTASQIPKEIYTMDINERGSRFKESIEVDDEKQTVIYNVPAHNNASESRVLVDYKAKISVTLLPKLKECYIRKLISNNKEPSLSETRRNMQMRQIVAEQNVTIPVETNNDVMIKIREIQPEKLSRKVLKFCAGSRVFLVKDMPLEQVLALTKIREGSRLQKRTYRFTVTPMTRAQALQQANSLQTGIYTCDEMRKYDKVISNCVAPAKIKYGCGPRRGLSTCIYTAICKYILGSGKPDGDPYNDRNGIVHVTIECKEKHNFTRQWCCDILCI